MVLSRISNMFLYSSEEKLIFLESLPVCKRVPDPRNFIQQSIVISSHRLNGLKDCIAYKWIIKTLHLYTFEAILSQIKIIIFYVHMKQLQFVICCIYIFNSNCGSHFFKWNFISIEPRKLFDLFDSNATVYHFW